MEIKFERIRPTLVKLHFTISNIEIAPDFENLKNRFLKAVAVQNQKQGQSASGAPNSEQLIIEQTKKNFLNKLVNIRFPWALQNMKLKPISKVNFEFGQWEAGTDFTFTAEFEVPPEIKEVKITPMKGASTKPFVSEKMIDDAIENMRKLKQSFVREDSDRPVRNFDYVVIDVDSFQGEELINDGSSKNLRLEIRNAPLQSFLEKQVIGMKVGESKAFDYSYEKSFPNLFLAGKTIKFKVQLKEISKAIVPELNEEFVRSVFVDKISGKMAFKGLPKTVAELRNYVKKEILFIESQKQFKASRELLLDKLIELNPIEIPPTLLARQRDSILSFERVRSAASMTAADLEHYLKSHDSEYTSTATKMVHSALLVDFLAKKNNVTCSQQDIEDFIRDSFRTSGESKEQIKRSLNASGRRDQIKFEIVQDKVVRLILEQLSLKIAV